MSEPVKLWVVINGIEIEHEAWLLIRLFFKDDSFRFYKGNESLSGPVLHIEVKDDGVCLYRADYYSHFEGNDIYGILSSGKIRPDISVSRAVSPDDLQRPGGTLLNSHKINVGALIYEVLSGITGKQLPYGSLTGIRPVKLAIACIRDGLDKNGTINALVYATGMSREKAELLYAVAETEMPYIKIDPRSIHIYVGIPFCTSRCLYCSFVSYPADRCASLIPDYIEALEKEIRFAGEVARSNDLAIRTVYIGGGTPTALDSHNLNRVLELMNEYLDIRNAEFTVEAGRPDTIDEDKLRVLKSNNVTRISINPQTMNMETLKVIGRNHTPNAISQKFYLAREMGFGNINMDIIAGLPYEDTDMFKNTLEKVEEMAPDSLTVHTMAVKRASKLHGNIDDYRLTEDSTVENMTEAARRSAERMGMRPYYLYRQKNILANLENTGYSKPGFECVYNINTMDESQTIIALGAGAISKFVSPDGKKIERACNVKEVAQYIERIDEMIGRKEAFISF